MSVVVTSVPDRMLNDMRVIGYVRTRPEESPAGMAAQEHAIRAGAAAREWELLDIVHDSGSPGDNVSRPLLAAASR